MLRENKYVESENSNHYFSTGIHPAQAQGIWEFDIWQEVMKWSPF